MTTTVWAVYEDGVLKPSEPLPLAEHSRVRVVVDSDAAEAADDEDPEGWEAIDSVIGALKGTPPDLSENHDHYLYRKTED